MKDNYYSDGKRYDADYSSRTDDIDFYVQRCEALASEVLELGCGTGRVTIPIARRGISITGLDASEAMLGTAREKLAALVKLGAAGNISAARAEFIRADMTQFDLGRKFRTVIMPFNVLQHLYDLRSIKLFFSCLREHMEENGVLILDVLNPDLYELSRKPGEHALYDSFTVDGKLLVIEDTVDYDPITQVAHYVMSYCLDGKQLYDLDLYHRMFFPQELELLLHENGFHITERFGDFDSSPLTPASPSQILVSMYKS